MDRRALVLGGGGVTGIAWETRLAGLGIDLAAADLIVGTSAGAVAGTDIACGQEIKALYRAQLAPSAPEPGARIGWDFIGGLLWDVQTSRDPKRPGRGSAGGLDVQPQEEGVRSRPAHRRRARLGRPSDWTPGTFVSNPKKTKGN